MPVARADVRAVCFLHWPVAVDPLADLLPAPLSPATRSGSAWISVLGQRTLAGVAGVPWRFEYRQLAVRTYVAPAVGGGGGADGNDAGASSGDAGPAQPDVGVYFLRVDAGSRLASLGARFLYGVPFRHANVVHSQGDDGFAIGTDAGDGTPAFRARIEPTGNAVAADAGSLVAWLTDRYRYYLPDGRRGETGHEPWPLAPATATVTANDLFERLSLPEPEEEPMVRYSPGVAFRLAKRA